MNLNMSNRDKKLLLVLVGIIVVVLVYMLVFTKFKEKNAVVEAENATLQMKIDELASKQANEAAYVQETEELNAQLNETLAKYPTWINVEDEVMQLVEFESKSKITISAATITDPEFVDLNAQNGEAVADAAEPVEQAASEASGRYSLYSIDENISYNATYRQLKMLLDHIKTDDTKKSIKSISAIYDSNSGELSGAINYKSFFVTGQIDKNYEATKIPAVKHGTTDPFGTIDASGDAGRK